MHECVRRAGLPDAYVELLCTRGRPAPGLARPAHLHQPLHGLCDPVRLDRRPRGSAAASTSWPAPPQRIPPASVDPRVKNYHWLDFVMGLFEAYERGGDTVVLVDAEGHVTEGPGFNVFAVLQASRRGWSPPPRACSTACRAAP